MRSESSWGRCKLWGLERSLDFTLSESETFWRVLTMRETWSDLHFKGMTLIVVLKMHKVEGGGIFERLSSIIQAKMMVAQPKEVSVEAVGSTWILNICWGKRPTRLLLLSECKIPKEFLCVFIHLAHSYQNMY